jgi:formamidopyrimidine-DNA glycosylase
MPELPDVETQKRRLDESAVGRTILHARVRESRILQVSPSHLRRTLKGELIERSRRRGKYLFAELSGGQWLVMHFGMTGWLQRLDGEAAGPEEHTKLRLDLDGGGHLAYVCTRQLGEIGLTRSETEFATERDLGPDALEVEEDDFVARLEARRGGVKSTLMNQSVVAGLGNVWIDEVLFQHGVHPRASLGDSSEDERRRLVRSTKRVLSEGIEHGADPQSMPEHWLLPNREDGKPCPRCTGKIQSLEVGGRTSYHCPEHQPEYPTAHAKEGRSK